MLKIEKYQLTWRPADDSGMIHLILADGEAASISIDSAGEASFLLELLRKEPHLYYDKEHELICTGMEEEGKYGTE